MGYWNGTCAISNLHIMSGQDVMVLMLTENQTVNDFCYNNSLYRLLPIPFYGKYNDYGAAKELSGFSLNLVEKIIKSKLYEFSEGSENAVTKELFNMDNMFDAAHENRLFVEGQDTRVYAVAARLEELKRQSSLSEKETAEFNYYTALINNPNTKIRMTPILIHMDIVNSILDNYYIEETHGYDADSNRIVNQLFFKDLIKELPTLIEKIKGDKEYGGINFDMLMDNSNPTLSFISNLVSCYQFSKEISYIKLMGDVLQHDNCVEILTDILKVLWIDQFMTSTRKLWTPPAGSGSQSDVQLGYRVLAQGVVDILDKEQSADYR